MDSGRKYYLSRENWSVLVWTCFVLLSLNVLAVIFLAAAPYIQADVFRHLKEVVLPFLNGQEGFFILWSNHHPVPLLHLIQIFNLKFLGFRLDYEAYLGLFFQIHTAFVILRSIKSTTASWNRDIGAIGGLGAILIVFIYFGFNTLVQYTWPLVTAQQYLYFFGIVAFIAADKCARSESGNRYLLIAFASLVLMFANFDYGTIFLASIFVAIMLSYLIERRPVYLRVALVLMVAWVAYRFFLLAILPEHAAGPSMDIMRTLQYLVLNSPRILMQFSIALSSGLVDMFFLKKYFSGATPFLVGASLLMTLLFVATFAIYLRQKLFRVSLTPLALMLIPLFYSLPIFVFRRVFLGDDIWNLASPRYVPTFKLAIVGMLWAQWLILSERMAFPGQPLRSPYKAMIAVSIGVILFIQGAQIYVGWGGLKYNRSNQENHALGLFLAGNTLENDIVLPRDIVKGNKDYQGVLAYLEKNKLNVFSDKFPSSRLLDQHVESRRMFYASVAAVTSDTRITEYEEISGQAGNIDATWEMSPQSVVIDSRASVPLYIRVAIASESYDKRGNSLIAEFGNGDTRAIRLYKGKQNLFFSLEKGARLRINVPAPSVIEGVELRR